MNLHCFLKLKYALDLSVNLSYQTFKLRFHTWPYVLT